MLCDGFGYCAELAPELVSLDEWGYPVIHHDVGSARLADVARAAVRECPRRALFFQEITDREPTQDRRKADSAHR